MGDVTKHATLSPSGASGWMNCPGWRGGGGSAYAREGTAAHELAAWCLVEGTDANAYLGRLIQVEGDTFEVNADMAEAVQRYVDTVRQVRDATGGELLVEQSLPIDHITGEEDACGTADAVILAGSEIIVIDLKFGRGVQVDAQENEQMQMYALGAVEQYDMLGDFASVRMMIVQPRIGHVSEWACSIEALKAFGKQAKAAAIRTNENVIQLNPGEKQCRWCTNKATCSALRDEVVGAVFGGPSPATADEFANLEAVSIDLGMDYAQEAEGAAEYLAAMLGKLDIIEDWCKAVRARGEELLRKGVAVPGYKLVQGKKGNRKWSDAAAAEAAMKAMRLKHDDMFEYSLISPTTAEKLAKTEVIGKRQWPKLQALITQSEGGLTVVPASDKRPAVEVKPVADEFTDINTKPAEDAALDLI